MKGVKGMKIILIVFSEKILFRGKCTIFGLKMTSYVIAFDPRQIFFFIFKGAKRYMKTMLFFFKFLIGGNQTIFSSTMMYPHNFRFASMIVFKFFLKKGAKRQVKIMLMVFLQNNLLWGKCTIFNPLPESSLFLIFFTKLIQFFCWVNCLSNGHKKRFRKKVSYIIPTVKVSSRKGKDTLFNIDV